MDENRQEDIEPQQVLSDTPSPMTDEMKKFILDVQEKVAKRTPVKWLELEPHEDALKIGKRLWIEGMKFLDGEQNGAFISKDGQNWTVLGAQYNEYAGAPEDTEFTITNETGKRETVNNEEVDYITSKFFYITPRGVISEVRNWAETEDEPRPPKKRHVTKEELGKDEINDLINLLTQRKNDFNPASPLSSVNIDKNLGNQTVEKLRERFEAHQRNKLSGAIHRIRRALRVKK